MYLGGNKMSSSGLCTYKDEVMEIREKLNDNETTRDTVKCQQYVQQAIFYMTKGVDMTSLFTSIVKVAATKDAILKKLCYLYLCHYASSHAHLALLTVNTLVRDAQDTNHMIRGLAIRSIGSLRLSGVVQYTKDVVMRGLQDHSSYVRKTAVITCLHLYKLVPEQFNVDNLILQLNERLRKDKDMQVRRNSMYVLEELPTHEKSPDRFFKFFSKRLVEFDDWGKQFALNVLKRNCPYKEDDIYSTLNRLDGCLKHPNTSVVLAAIRVFLPFTEKLIELRDDIFQRIRVPLITALLSKSPEIAYCVACHILMVLNKSPSLFDSSISSFYCRSNDPTYLRIKKLEILSKFVCNAKQVVEEFSYHVDHSETSSYSIQTIKNIAILRPVLARMCCDILILLLHSRDSHVVSRALVSLRDLVGQYDLESQFVFDVSQFLHLDLLPEGKACVVWILGEYGERIPEAPYILESMCDEIEREISAIVKLELLTACMKLFFQRPPECQATLAHLLHHCSEREVNMDVRERALVYYRLLKLDVNKAREVILCPRNKQLIHNASFIQLESEALQLDQFNTVSLVYGKTRYNHQLTTSSTDDDIKKEQTTNRTTVGNEKAVTIEQLQVVETNLVELDEDDITPTSGKVSNCDVTLTSLEDGNDQENMSTLVVDNDIQLIQNPELSPKVFESLWTVLPESESYELEVDEFPHQDKWLGILASKRIYTMASTPTGVEQSRYFLYAKDECFILCEVRFDTVTRKMKCVFKMEDSSNVHSFIELFQSCFTQSLAS